jgi:hypothetical protein
VLPHISADGRNEAQTSGRPGWSKIRQRSSSSSWMQRMPAGLPPGMPGMGELIDGAMQQAAQRERHSIDAMLAAQNGAGS